MKNLIFRKGGSIFNYKEIKNEKDASSSGNTIPWEHEEKFERKQKWAVRREVKETTLGHPQTILLKIFVFALLSLMPT